MRLTLSNAFDRSIKRAHSIDFLAVIRYSTGVFKRREQDVPAEEWKAGKGRRGEEEEKEEESGKEDDDNDSVRKDAQSCFLSPAA